MQNTLLTLQIIQEKSCKALIECRYPKKPINDLVKILDDLLIGQSIQLLHEEIIACSKNSSALEPCIRKEFNCIEYVLLQEFNPEITDHLKMMSKATEGLSATNPFYWQETRLRFALRIFLQDPPIGVSPGLWHLSIADKINKIMNTPSYRLWQQTNKEKNEKLEILESIERIKSYAKNPQYHNSQTVHQAVYRASNYFITSLATTNTLAFVKVKSISFIYTKTQEDEGGLILFINDEEQLAFTGKVAHILNIILKKPLKEFDLENLGEDPATKPAYDRVSNQLKRANKRIFQLQKFGIQELIKVEGYSCIKANPLYAHLIQPYK